MNIKFGIIGAGMIGSDHAKRINNSLNGGIVTAVNDINTESARRLVAELGTAEVFEDPYELIRSPEVSAILICSIGSTHEEFVLASIAAGKYVFCEKPLATSARACKNIVDAEMNFGKRLVQVGFMRRYDSGYQKLKKVIENYEIGDVLMIHCAHRNPTVPESYVTEMAVSDSLVHEIDVIRWLLKEDYVTAQMIFAKKTKRSHVNLHDPQILLLETKSGIRIDVEMFVNCQYGYDIQCELVGSDGIAKLPEPESLVIRKDEKKFTSIDTDWKKRFIKAYDMELQEFIDGIVGNKIQGPSSWDGYVAAIACDICIKAQKTKAIEPFSIVETPKFYR